MLSTSSDVIRCLTTYTDWWQPASSSVLLVGAARRSSEAGDGLHPGVLDTLDERTELCRRVAQLPERERTILVLWYVVQAPVAEIGRRLRVSQRQCHRLRAKAVRLIVELAPDDAEAA